MTDEDIAVPEAMGGQIAYSIGNLHLHKLTEAALKQLDNIHRWRSQQTIVARMRSWDPAMGETK